MIKSNSIYFKILENIKNTKLLRQSNVTLLAVSKKTNIENIKCLYDLGQKDFGENYVDELIEKANLLNKDINWHFIGHLQSNKAKKVLSIKNMTTISSVDSYKLASVIDTICQKLYRKVDIYIQVNISEEETKSGVKYYDAAKLYADIYKNLKNINLKGIMSLGEIGNEEQFEKLYQLKLIICNNLKLNINEVGISNGTSNDYKVAIDYGSTQVRIGTILFSKYENELSDKNHIENELNKINKNINVNNNI